MAHKVLVAVLTKTEEVFKYHCFFLQGRPSFTLLLPPIVCYFIEPVGKQHANTL